MQEDVGRHSFKGNCTIHSHLRYYDNILRKTRQKFYQIIDIDDIVYSPYSLCNYYQLLSLLNTYIEHLRQILILLIFVNI